MPLLELFPPILQLESKVADEGNPISAIHSGNVGDVIYSLPTAYCLGVTHFILNVCTDPGLSGRVMTSEAALKLAPLLLDQGSVRRVSVIRSQIPLEYAEPGRLGIDHILDVFRTGCVDSQFHLVHRHSFPFGIRVDGAKAWLESESFREDDLPEGITAPYLVVGLTRRYRRSGEEYYASLLRDVPPTRVVFVGVEEDLVQKTSIPGAYLKPNDFAHLARVIRGAALFVGNPSLPYAVAEALKTPRLVELAEGINVAPLDPTGLPLHMYSVEFLRSKIFDAIQSQPPELLGLADRVRTLEEEIRLLESHLVDSTLRSADFTTRTDELAREVQHLRSLLDSERFLVKSLARQLMNSTRPGRWTYRSLGRIKPLKRVWRSLGPS